MRMTASFIVGLALLATVCAAGTGNMALGEGTDPDKLKSVSADELQQILTDPALNLGRKVALLRDLEGRPLGPEAIGIAKAGLRTNDPPVIQALADLLVKTGKQADALAVLMDVASHPTTSYDRWVGAVALRTTIDPARSLACIRQLKMAVTRTVEQIRKEDAKNRQEFLRALSSSDMGRLVLVFTSCRAMEQFLADAVADGDEQIASLALSLLSRDPSLYYFPARGLPALARIAEGEDKESASTASKLLRSIIGEDKPDDQGWQEWGEYYGADSVLLQASLSRALDQECERRARRFAVRQSLSLATDAGRDEFVRCANLMLELAQDEKETIQFRGNIVLPLLGHALQEVEAPALRKQVRDILFSWLDSPTLDVRLIAANHLMGLAGTPGDNGEVKEKFTSILKNKGEPYILRTTAAHGLYFIGGSDDTELARETLAILKDAERIPAEERTCLQLRALLSIITGLPADSPISTWEKNIQGAVDRHTGHTGAYRAYRGQRGC